LDARAIVQWAGTAAAVERSGYFIMYEFDTGKFAAAFRHYLAILVYQ
jgi:hypothetical protein